MAGFLACRSNNVRAFPFSTYLEELDFNQPNCCWTVAQTRLFNNEQKRTIKTFFSLIYPPLEGGIKGVCSTIKSTIDHVKPLCR